MQPAVRQNPNNALLAKLVDMVIDLRRDGDTRASRAEERAQRAEERIQKAEKHAQKTEEEVEFLLQETNISCMDRLFLRQDELLLLLLIRGQEDLPWERTAEEVEKMYPRDSKSSQRCYTWVTVSLREARAKHVALIHIQVTVDAGKTSSAHEFWIQGTISVCLFTAVRPSMDQ